MPMLAQEIHRYAMFPAKIEGGRANRARSETTNGFQMMDRDREFFRVADVRPVSFGGWQIWRVQGHFHLQREMISPHIAARRHQIECVLLNGAHVGSDLK
jgi:hypothetical protein